MRPVQCMLAISIGMVCLVAIGCSRGPKLGKVSGRVTYKDKLVTTGTIMFVPEHGRPAIGQIGPDGTYTLTTNVTGDGALVGNHKVSIQSTRVGPSYYTVAKSYDEEVELARSPKKTFVPGDVEWLVPEKYSREETSPLTASVREGPNEINFDLPAEP